MRVVILAARYHREIVDRLEEGALAAFAAAGGSPTNVSVIEAPGAFELPALADGAAACFGVDAVVCLGCVLTGETSHDRYICDAVAHGLTEVSIEYRKPVAFGILTCQTMAQAKARAGGDHGNKGEEAMRAALCALAALRELREMDDTPCCDDEECCS